MGKFWLFIPQGCDSMIPGPTAPLLLSTIVLYHIVPFILIIHNTNNLQAEQLGPDAKTLLKYSGCNIMVGKASTQLESHHSH